MRRIPLVTVSFALSIDVACGYPDEHPAAISGTELVTLSGSPWSISVSPDERWLAFWELSKGIEHPYDAHLCTLELAKTRKTTHKIDDAYNQLSSYGHVEPWQQVASGFQAACWLDGQCYVLVIPGAVPKWLCFTPTLAEASWSAAPSDLTCSDCPSPRLVESLAEKWVGRWLLTYGSRVSLAWWGEPSTASLYHLDPSYPGVGIVRTDSSGSQLVVQHPGRKFHNIELVALRISPDERYLAYGLLSKLRAPIPLPDQEIELRVYDLEQEKDYEVSSGYRYMSNLIWSSDSKRLYFAGFQGDLGAVYRLDVVAVLEGERS